MVVEALQLLKKCPKCTKKFRKRGVFMRHYRRKHDEKQLTWSLKKGK